MLDMNCDGMICETDLFTFMELHNGGAPGNDFF